MPKKNKSPEINITPSFQYLPEESSLAENRFVWKYNILIENKSKETVQLLTRHWKIYNESDLVDQVFGPGVVGLQPLILPKKSFEYESFCILDTPTGKMIGLYEMQNVKCEHFSVPIPDIDLIADDYSGYTNPNQSGSKNKSNNKSNNDPNNDPITYN